MKTSTFEKGIPMLPRLGLCLAVLLGAPTIFEGCYSEGAQGDRCNPNRTSDECGSGLVCSGYSNTTGDPGQNWISANHPIAFCPEDYCCPADLSQATSPYCQPGCNGGAAAICAADPTNTQACAFSSCAADAADPENCPLDAGASVDSAAAPGDDGSGATTPEASPVEASGPEGG